MEKTITLSDISRAKKLAKVARRSDTSLTLNQHLDVISRQEFAVRHFHELKARQKTTMSQYLIDDGTLTRCRYCGMGFVPEYAEDVQEHEVVHERYEQAHAKLGFLPSPYSERELRKRAGYDGLVSADESTRREAAKSLVFVYFERSLDTAIRYDRWQRHPDFRTYARELAPTAMFLPEDLRRWLTQEYGPAKSGVTMRDTYWPATAPQL